MIRFVVKQSVRQLQLRETGASHWAGTRQADARPSGKTTGLELRLVGSGREGSKLRNIRGILESQPLSQAGLLLRLQGCSVPR